jgi:hypothetical protein
MDQSDALTTIYDADDEMPALMYDHPEPSSQNKIPDVHEEDLEDRKFLSYVHQTTDPSSWRLILPTIDQVLIAQHPRVVLDYLRFIDSYNEVSSSLHKIRALKIPADTVQSVLDHPSVATPAAEFIPEIRELKLRLKAHSA